MRKSKEISNKDILNLKLEEYKKSHQEKLEEKMNEINDLNLEIIELKNKIDINEENRNSVLSKENEILIKTDEYESKIKFLEDRKSFYEKTINDLK